MIGLDTNILVRYIIERRLTEENPGSVSIVAMVETVWVLERAYELTTDEIVGAVERMLQTDVLVVENEQEVFHRHDRTQGKTGVVRRRSDRSTGCQKRLFLHADVRPASATASGFRASLIQAGPSSATVPIVANDKPEYLPRGRKFTF